MSLEDVKRQYINKVHSIGKLGLGALFPNDFELYIFALELVDSEGDTEEYFIFPINPTSFEEVSNSNATITKTAGGIVVMNSNTFIPVSINMSGNFGRRFRILIGGDLITFTSLAHSSSAGSFQSFKGPTNTKKAVFNTKIKSGYGSIKILETILNKSRNLDRYNKPYSLYLYNLALGNSYLVKENSFTFKQDMSSNMIWNYTIQLTGLGNLDTFEGKDRTKSLRSKLIFSQVAQRAANVAVNRARKSLGI